MSNDADGMRKDFAADEEYMEAIIASFGKESPRGKVLVALSIIDDLLRDVIGSFLVEGADRTRLLDGMNAPLGTLSTRISMAHALGLISDQERRECDLLRRIRNELAHGFKEPDFERGRIRDLAAILAVPFGSLGESWEAEAVSHKIQVTALLLIFNLRSRRSYAREKRLSTAELPSVALRTYYSGLGT